MRFKIVSAGYQCAQFMQRTLDSIETQTLDNWDVGIVYDPSKDNGSELIKAWCGDDQRRTAIINTERKFATRNQYETITLLAPEDDDVVVFLDLDGDQLAHPGVLERLKGVYDSGVLLTYGQYKPVPDMGTSGLAQPYPKHVVEQNSYRDHHRKGGIGFNHLRTISGQLFNAMSESSFKWRNSGSRTLPGGKRFRWEKDTFYEGGCDYLFMVQALELAGGKYHCFDEVLLNYNHANPLADNKNHPHQTDLCVLDFFSRPPLQPLDKIKRPRRNMPASTPSDNVFLTAHERRLILREYGKKYGLKILIETGTNDGGTPEELKKDFDSIYTIELGERQWQAAVKKFRNSPHIYCLHGDSAEVLPNVLNMTNPEPTLLWLDGHWSKGDTALGPKETPVIEELAAVFATKVRHVILVDDARLFEGMPEYGEHDWPHIKEIEKMAVDANYSFEVKDDIIRLLPQ